MSNIIDDIDDRDYLLFKPVRFYLNLQIVCFFIMFVSAILTVPIIIFFPLFGLLSSQTRKSRLETHFGYTLCFTLISILATYIYTVSEPSPKSVALILLWIVIGLVFFMEIIIMDKMKTVRKKKFEINMIVLFEKSKISNRLDISYIANLLEIDEILLVNVLENKNRGEKKLDITKYEILLPSIEEKRLIIKILEESFHP